jgi:hypothetical protein
MQNPSTAQIRIAIEVLKHLGDRVNQRAADSVIMLQDSQFGDRHAARIETKSIEAITRIQSVTTQLEQWRDELVQQRRQCVSHHV